MQEITKKQQMIQMRSGIELYIDEEKSIKLQRVLQEIKESKFIQFENQTLNTADIVGIFDIDTVENAKRQKRGEWQCEKGEWHAKFDKCECGFSGLDRYPLMNNREIIL
jgi:predicted transcriptional regulator